MSSLECTETDDPKTNHSSINGHLIKMENYDKIDTTIVDLFDRWALQAPKRIAAEWQGKSITYSALRNASLHVSQALLRAGVQPRAHVPLLTRMSLEMLPAVIGILRLGACYVPIDVATWGLQRVQAALEAISSPLVIATTSVPEVELPTITVNFQKNWLHEEELENLVELESQLDDRRRQLMKQDLVWILFTSGTTGKPKGIMIPHSAVYAYSQLDLMDITSAEVPIRNLLAFSVAFDGCASVIWMTLTQGHTLVMASPSNFPDVSASCNVLMLTPSMLEVIDPSGPYDRVRYIFLGAENPNLEVVRQWITPTRKVFTTYGPSETTCIVTLGLIDPDKEISLGEPLPGVRIVLVDEMLRECDQGEVMISGPGVGIGYLNNEALTAQKFIQWDNERFYRTGDLARRTQSGQLVWAGRADSLIKNRGFLINLETEVEPAMLSFASVRKAVAFKWRDKLIGYIQPATVDIDALREFLKDRFDPFIIPDEIFALDQLPLNANGKVDKAKLREQRETQLCSEEVQDKEGEAGPRLEILRAVLSSALHVATSQLNASSSFIMLGGNSMTAIRVSQSLRRHGFQISAVQILRLDTVGKLAQALETIIVPKEPLENLNSGRIPVTPSQNLSLRRSIENPLSVSLVSKTEWVGERNATPTARELYTAFTKVLSAHSIFRTRFHIEDMTLSGIDFLNLRWKEVSVEESEFDQACIRAEQQAWNDAETLTQADIEVPLFHLTCISVPGRKALAYITHIHHILIDVVSQGIIMQDLDRALSGEMIPEGPRIEEFATFMSVYKQDNLENATRRVSDMLRPLFSTNLLRLPPPLPTGSLHVGLLRLDTPFAVHQDDFDAAVRDIRCTSSTLVYAAWALFLSCISTEECVGFRISLAGRGVPWPQAQSVVGCLIDSLPFSATIPRNNKITVHNWLSTVHKTTLDLLAIDGLGPALPASIMSEPHTTSTNVLCFIGISTSATTNWKTIEHQKHVYPIAWYVITDEHNNVATRFEIQRAQVNEDWAKAVADLPVRILRNLVKANSQTLLSDLFEELDTRDLNAGAWAK